MATFYNKIKNLWIFRGRANFLLFFGGTSTGLFCIQRYKTDKKLYHPMVSESIRLLSKNAQIIELIGYPIEVKSSISARANIKDEDSNFIFQVKGPKGVLQVDLQGDSNTYQNIEKNEENFKKYYIIDAELQSLINSKSEKELLNEQIPSNGKFWKINYLYADLAGQYRITIIPINEKVIQQPKKASQNQQPFPYFALTQRQSLKDLETEYNRRYLKQQDGEVLSDVDIEERRKYRQQTLYKKIGYVRLYMFLILTGGAMGIYVYVQKNRRKDISGSTLHLMAKHMLQNNPWLKQQFGPNIQFSQYVRGQQVDNLAEFETDILGKGITGIAKIKGQYDAKKSQWAIDSLNVQIKDQSGNIKQSKKLI